MITLTEYIEKLKEHCETCIYPAVYNGLSQALELAERLNNENKNIEVKNKKECI